MTHSATTNQLATASKYGPINTWDIMKFIAICLMVIDHIGYLILFDDEVTRAIGRSAMTIFMFLTGWSNHRAIGADLIVMAIVTQFFLVGYVQPYVFPLNILVTIIITRRLLHYIDQHKWLQKNVLLLFAIGSLLEPLYLVIEYAGAGFIYAGVGYVYRKKLCTDKQNMALLVFAGLFHAALSQYFFEFDATGVVIMLSALVLVNRTMWRFELKPVAFKGITAAVIMFISRNALYIYLLHQVMLLVIRIIVFE